MSAPGGTAAPQPRIPLRKRTWVQVVLGVAAAIILSVVASHLNGAATPAAGHTVVYQADGVGTAQGLFNLQTPTGGQQSVAALPLQTASGGSPSFSGLESGQFLYISVQNQSASGTVTCSIVLDGKVISSNTSTGGYVIATCEGRVP